MFLLFYLTRVAPKIQKNQPDKSLPKEKTSVIDRILISGVVLVFLFAVLGELARLPFGPENGILPNDLFFPILIILWLFKKFTADRIFPQTKLALPFLVFIAIAFIALLNGSRYLTPSETAVSGLYLIRFIEYFFLYFIVLDLAEKRKRVWFFLKIILGAGLLLAFLGFLQLKFYPSFKELEMQDLGWDPHEGRLLSTWFDPNFVGGLMAFLFCLVLGVFLSLKKSLFPKKISFSKNPKFLLFLTGLVFLAALFLTYSRSAYLALALGIFIIGALRSRKFLIGAIILGVLLISFSSRAQERISNLYHSALSLVTETAELPDPTARLRIESWRNALEIIKDHPLLGVGYNAYRYASLRYGFVKEITVHSGSGSDSSFLTILATTGIFGLLAFLWLYLRILKNSWAVWRRDLNPLSSGLALGLLGGVSALLIHSFFVNSLLFAPLLIFFWTSLGLLKK